MSPCDQRRSNAEKDRISLHYSGFQRYVPFGRAIGNRRLLHQGIRCIQDRKPLCEVFPMGDLKVFSSKYPHCNDFFKRAKTCKAFQATQFIPIFLPRESWRCIEGQLLEPKQTDHIFENWYKRSLRETPKFIQTAMINKSRDS